MAGIAQETGLREGSLLARAMASLRGDALLSLPPFQSRDAGLYPIEAVTLRRELLQRPLGAYF